MAVNYQAALDQLLKYDVGRNAYFDVSIPKPSSLNTGTLFSDLNTKTLTYLCHSAELPGESIATVSQKIYGVVEKFPIMAGYNDISLSFYTPGSGIEEVRLAFLSWISLFTGRGEVLGITGTTYNVRYKDDIVSNPVITQYTSTGEKLLSCTLRDAFPISISQIPLSWSAANEAISFNVTFAYTEYEYEFFENSKNSNTFASNINNAFVQPKIQPFNTTLNSFLTQDIASAKQQQSTFLTPNLQSLNQG